MDLSIDTLHLKDTSALFEFEGSANYFPVYLLSSRIMLGHCSSTMTKDRFLIRFHVTKWSLCGDVPLNPYSIHRLSHFTFFNR